MPDLRDWIEAQLKRGYSRKQIKSALIRKGYSPKAVAEVDRIRDSALPNKKIIEKSPSKPIALVGIVIAIVFLIWLFNALPFFSKQASEDVAEQKSAEQMREEEAEASMVEEEMKELQKLESGGELSVSETLLGDLCNEFKELEYETSCEEAVALALKDSPGKVEKVSIGTMQIPDPSAIPLKWVEKEMWRVDIKLENPYSDKNLGKEIKSLRIGVGLNEDIGIHRRPIE